MPRRPPAAIAPSRDRARRDMAILDWALEGRSLEDIARALPAAGFEPLSRSQLRRLLRSAREAAKARPQEEARRLDLLRLDQLQAVHFAKAIAGDNPATDRVLAIMDRRAKLLAAPPTAQETAESESARKALLEKLNAIAARLMGAGAG
ncbi:MAG: hypothetical protein ABSD90_18420 [Methylocystis sp.]|jgi:hypothetical protein